MTNKRKDSKGKVLREGESERKDGRYVYRYTDQFGKRHCVYAKNLNELRAMEKEIQTASVNGISPAASKITLSKYAENWLSMRRNVKYSTLRHYKVSIRDISESGLGKLVLQDVTPMHIKQFCLYLSDQKGFKYNTVNAKYSFVNMLFNDAIENMLITSNPCTFKLRNLIQKSEKKVRYMSKEEEKIFLNFCQTDAVGQKHYFQIKFLLNTGLRFGEFAGLTWSDIDLKNNSITVSRQLMRVGNKFVLADTKTKSGNRTIYISNELCKELEEYKKLPRPKVEPILDGHSNFVFFNSTGNHLTNVAFNVMLGRLKNKCEEATQCRLGDITAHVFRHTYCSRLLEKGVPLKVVQYTMGHSDAGTTLNVYSHLEPEIIKRNMLMAQ